MDQTNLPPIITSPAIGSGSVPNPNSDQPVAQPPQLATQETVHPYVRPAPIPQEQIQSALETAQKEQLISHPDKATPLGQFTPSGMVKNFTQNVNPTLQGVVSALIVITLVLVVGITTYFISINL